MLKVNPTGKSARVDSAYLLIIAWISAAVPVTWISIFPNSFRVKDSSVQVLESPASKVGPDKAPTYSSQVKVIFVWTSLTL